MTSGAPHEGLELVLRVPGDDRAGRAARSACEGLRGYILPALLDRISLVGERFAAAAAAGGRGVEIRVRVGPRKVLVDVHVAGPVERNGLDEIDGVAERWGIRPDAVASVLWAELQS